jgi:hypothetical protein
LITPAQIVGAEFDEAGAALVPSSRGDAQGFFVKGRSVSIIGGGLLTGSDPLAFASHARISFAGAHTCLLR